MLRTTTAAAAKRTANRAALKAPRDVTAATRTMDSAKCGGFQEQAWRALSPRAVTAALDDGSLPVAQPLRNSKQRRPPQADARGGAGIALPAVTLKSELPNVVPPASIGSEAVKEQVALRGSAIEGCNPPGRRSSVASDFCDNMLDGFLCCSLYCGFIVIGCCFIGAKFFDGVCCPFILIRALPPR